MAIRTLHDLIDRVDPAWPLVSSWIAAAPQPVQVLPVDEAARCEALVALQVTTRSPMGAVVYETGGILADRGWVRILGCGHPRLPRSLPGWNRGRTWEDTGRPWPWLLVADDVVGGSFAINGGGLPGPSGHLHYFAPDSLAWEELNMGYSAFLHWVLTEDLERFYTGARWPGWERDVAALPGDRSFSIAPPLWAVGPPIADRDRRPVPTAEIYDLQLDIARQMKGQG